MLNPIKEAKTIIVSGNSVLDEEATATAKEADPAAEDVYVIKDEKIDYDKFAFFIKNPTFAQLTGAKAKYRIDEQEVYLQMSNTTITFLVEEGDSVDVVVTCSKNSCKQINEDDDASVTTDRACKIQINDRNTVFGNDDVTAEGGNIVKFGLSGGKYEIQKWSNTGGILISSIDITPAQKDATGISTVKSVAENAALYNLAGQKVSAAFKGVVVKNGKKVVLK